VPARERDLVDMLFRVGHVVLATDYTYPYDLDVEALMRLAGTESPEGAAQRIAGALRSVCRPVFRYRFANPAKPGVVYGLALYECPQGYAAYSYEVDEARRDHEFVAGGWDEVKKGLQSLALDLIEELERSRELAEEPRQLDEIERAVRAIERLVGLR